MASPTKKAKLPLNCMIRQHINHMDLIKSQLDRSFAAIETWMGSGELIKIKKEFEFAKLTFNNMSNNLKCDMEYTMNEAKCVIKR